jgi:putative exosortase-associated protein (TIGR04073 family)
MRISIPLLGSLAVAALFSAGCAGPEEKLGRGINNVTEFARLGEIRRSMEETALWGNTDTAYTTGFIHGFDRSVVRTVVGAFEIVTFPFPSYAPYLRPDNEWFPGMAVNPVYPESYKPHFIADPSFGPDAIIGFSGGDIAPMIPGSRFRIFDY